MAAEREATPAAPLTGAEGDGYVDDWQELLELLASPPEDDETKKKKEAEYEASLLATEADMKRKREADAAARTDAKKKKTPQADRDLTEAELERLIS
jgi:hypothetical protein